MPTLPQSLSTTRSKGGLTMKLIKTFLTHAECLAYLDKHEMGCHDHGRCNLQIFSDPLSGRWEIYDMDKEEED